MEEWKEYKLGECVEMQKGFAFKSSDYIKKGTKIIKVSNLNQKRFDDDSCVFISPNLADQYSRYSLLEDDIIISTVGSWPTNPESVVGKICRVPKIINGSLLNQNAVRLRVKNGFDQRFVFYLLSQSNFSSYITSTAQGSANQASITLEDIRAYLLNCPSIEEQRIISYILKSLDDKIEVNKKINDNLELQAKTLFKSWFVDFKPFKNGDFVESELGMIPKGWSVGVLADIIEENPKSTIQVNQARGEKGKYPFFTSGSAIFEYESPIVYGRNVFLNTGGVAGVKFFIGGAAYSTDTWCIRGIDDYTDYLYLFLSTIEDVIDKQYFEGSALKHLKKKNLKERVINIPPDKVITDFNKLVVPFYNSINMTIKENRRLAEIRDTLLPRLMSGELNVNEII